MLGGVLGLEQAGLVHEYIQQERDGHELDCHYPEGHRGKALQ